MQRLFSSFPRGWPGVGLLLLRMAVGVSLVVHGEACLAGEEHVGWAFLVSLLAGLLIILVGAALLIGFLTTLAALLAGLVIIGMALPPFVSIVFGSNLFGPNILGGTPATIYLIVMAAAVLLLGPGAFSLDARLFGRREIVIPLPER